MKKNLAIFCLLFFNLASIFAQNQHFRFSHLSVKDGLSQSIVTSICQDNLGLMWFATQEGLNRYDGYQFAKYLHQPSDSNSIGGDWINYIYKDKKGDLWVTTLGGGLCFYNSEKNNFTVYKHDPKKANSISSNDVYSIIEDSKGYFWISTFAGLDIFDRKNNKFIHHTSYTKSTKVDTRHGIIEDKNGQIWVASYGNGVFVIDINSQKTKQIYTTANGLSSNLVTHLEQTKDNQIWVATYEKGITVFDNNLPKPFYYTSQNSGLPKDFVWTIKTDSQGDLWIGTENGGLIHFDKKTETFSNHLYNKDNNTSISHNDIFSIYEDQIGNMWIGTYTGGINYWARKEEGKFVSINTANSTLSHNSVLPIIEDQEGKIWLGTDGGGLNVFDPQNNSIKTYRHDPKDAKSLSSDVIISLRQTSEGDIWIGAYKGGINVYDRKKDKFLVYKHDPKNPNSLANDVVWHIFEDSQKNIWIGTDGGGMDKFDKEKKQFIHYKTAQENGLNNINTIRPIYEDKQQNLWVGTFQGLNLLNKETKKFKNYSYDIADSQSISHNIVMVIFEDSKNRFWVGTYGGGLNLMDRKTGKFTRFQTQEGLPSNIIFGITEDAQGYLWISTNKGLAKFDVEKRFFKNYDAESGLQSNEFNQNGYLKTRSGKMYFGGVGGFDFFDPALIRHNPFIPSVLITNFKIFNKTVSIQPDSPLKKNILYTKEIELDHTQSVFSIEFVALNFTHAQRNQYAYKLEGFDKEWNEMGTKREATYTNLDAGTYVFKVKGSNNDGIWNEKPTELIIIIHPPFWKTWWFKTFAVLLVLGSAYAYYRNRINTIKAQNHKLERQVQERTTELQNQKEEILTQNSELEQQKEEIQSQRDAILHKNSQMLDSIRYAQTIQKAILPSKTSLNEIWGIDQHFVLFKPKDIVSGDFYWCNEIENKIFVAVADCTGHGVPGAFMTMISTTLLDKIIILERIFSPNEILEELNKEILVALRQQHSENRDGMDIALCSVEKTNNLFNIQFEGAKRPLYYSDQTEKIQVLEGSRKSIGGFRSSNKSFNNKNILLAQNAMIYLCTDGFADQADQFGQKIGSKKQIELLNEINHLPLPEQRTFLKQILSEKLQKANQRDDISFMGIRLQ